MEKKRRKPEDQLRRHHYRLRLSDDEEKRFLTNLTKAPGMTHADFIRMMIMDGYVYPQRSKQDLSELLKVLEELQEYKAYFARIANYMRYSHPETEKECREIASIFKIKINQITES